MSRRTERDLGLHAEQRHGGGLHAHAIVEHERGHDRRADDAAVDHRDLEARDGFSERRYLSVSANASASVCGRQSSGKASSNWPVLPRGDKQPRWHARRRWGSWGCSGRKLRHAILQSRGTATSGRARSLVQPSSTFPSRDRGRIRSSQVQRTCSSASPLAYPGSRKVGSRAQIRCCLAAAIKAAAPWARLTTPSSASRGDTGLREHRRCRIDEGDGLKVAESITQPVDRCGFLRQQRCPCLRRQRRHRIEHHRRRARERLIGRELRAPWRWSRPLTLVRQPQARRPLLHRFAKRMEHCVVDAIRDQHGHLASFEDRFGLLDQTSMSATISCRSGHARA